MKLLLYFVKFQGSVSNNERSRGLYGQIIPKQVSAENSMRGLLVLSHVNNIFHPGGGDQDPLVAPLFLFHGVFLPKRSIRKNSI